MRLRNAARRAAESEADSTEVPTSDGSPMEVTSSESEGSSSESLRLVTPMVRFLDSDSEDNSSRSIDLPRKEASVEAEDPSSEGGESLESWSDPDHTLATIRENPGLAMSLF